MDSVCRQLHMQRTIHRGTMKDRNGSWLPAIRLSVKVGRLVTPLSVIRAEVDVALSAPREAAEYRDSLRRIQGESHRLRQLVEALDLSRVPVRSTACLHTSDAGHRRHPHGAGSGGGFRSPSKSNGSRMSPSAATRSCSPSTATSRGLSWIRSA